MKRRLFEGDPIEAVRGADPLDRLDVPKDTTGAHARALFQEVTSMETMEREPTVQIRPARRRRLALATAAAAVALVAVGSVAVLSGNDSVPDEQIAGGVPIASAAMCVESYDLITLANRDLALEGTLASINGEQVTFTVNRWFTGGTGEEITLDANGLTGITSAGGPGFEVGQRYLVSGSGGFVWGCGFTMTYDTNIANQWATVFGA